jgi:hypothetical protein
MPIGRIGDMSVGVIRSRRLECVRLGIGDQRELAVLPYGVDGAVCVVSGGVGECGSARDHSHSVGAAMVTAACPR